MLDLRFLFLNTENELSISSKDLMVSIIQH